MTVHQDRLLQWPYFRIALFGAFVEAESQCINLPEDRPAVVQAFLEFIYSGNYVYQPPQDQTALRCNKSGDNSASTHTVCPCKNFVICGTPPMKHTEPNFNQCLVCDHALNDHQVKEVIIGKALLITLTTLTSKPKKNIAIRGTLSRDRISPVQSLCNG